MMRFPDVTPLLRVGPVATFAVASGAGAAGAAFCLVSAAVVFAVRLMLATICLLLVPRSVKPSAEGCWSVPPTVGWPRHVRPMTSFSRPRKVASNRFFARRQYFFVRWHDTVPTAVRCRLDGGT